MTVGLLYYTCLSHDPAIEAMCRVQLDAARGKLPLLTVSLNQPIPFGDDNIWIGGTKGLLMMHRQILAGLKYLNTDVVYLCENDVLYHPSHFDYEPPLGTFAYNTNVWRVRWPDGLAVWTDGLQQVSGLCANRKLLIDFYSQRIGQIEREGFNRHYEPGIKQSVGGKQVVSRESLWPNLCIRHNANLTKSKWSPSEYRNSQYAKGWQEAHMIDGWGVISDLFKVAI